MVSVDYLDDPVIQLGVSKDFQVIVKNPRLVSLDMEASVKPPEGWDIQPRSTKATLEAGAESVCKLTIRVDEVKV